MACAYRSCAWRRRENGGGVPQLPSMICRQPDMVILSGRTRFIPSATNPVSKLHEITIFPSRAHCAISIKMAFHVVRHPGRLQTLPLREAGRPSPVNKLTSHSCCVAVLFQAKHPFHVVRQAKHRLRSNPVNKQRFSMPTSLISQFIFTCIMQGM